MRRFLLIITTLFMILSPGFGQEKELKNALDNINQGYFTIGFALLKDCADRGNTWAQFFLGQSYEYGYAFEKNPKEAFLLYRKTAEKGLGVAQYSVAKCYEQGFGTNINTEKALMWQKKSEGKFQTVDITYLTSIYNNGLKYPERYCLTPPGYVDKTHSNSNVNNTIGSNNQTINNITIVQAVPTQPIVQTPVKQKLIIRRSDVDENIPVINVTNSNTFALIIANENYQDVAKVPNAINDGTVFAEYCEKSLGLPSKNIHFVKDATLGNIKREINIIKQLADVIGEEAKIIVYYAGHGIPDESTKNAYLLPIDGSGSDMSTCYGLNDFYTILGKMPASQIVVLLDACFSGSLRGEGMLASARGVAIKAKPNAPSGKLVVFSAAQGDETAYPYKEQSHGLFTYFLLKKLKDTNGDVTLGELGDYITKEVKKVSIIENGKMQTPTVAASSSIGNWRDSKLR